MQTNAVAISPWIANFSILEPLDWHTLFQRDAFLHLDAGAGDGGFIIELAKRHPDENFVAIERLLGRARKIARKAERFGLNNLKVIRIETSYFLRYLTPTESLQTVHILFPDPWPKRRHAKYRLIQPEFVEMARQALKKEGVLRFVTDHEDYFKWACGVWQNAIGWKNLGPGKLEDWPATDFQKTFAEEGRAVFSREWQKME